MIAPIIRQRLPLKAVPKVPVSATKITLPTPPKRQFQRLELRLPVALCTKNYMIREEAYIGNISVGGSFLLTENYSLDKDERVCIEIATAAGKKLSIMATVIWSNLFPMHATPAGQKGVGVRFQLTQDPDVKKWMHALGVE